MTAYTSLTWGIKESLLRYIESIDDGEVSTVPPAKRHGDAFTFTLGETDTAFDDEAQTGTLQFLGAVALTAYAGELAIRVSDPRIELSEGRGFLKVRQQSFFTNEPFLSLGTVAVLDSRSEPSSEPGSAGNTQLTLSFTLGPGGQSIFGPQYAVGQELSQITVE
jgi:Htaa